MTSSIDGFEVVAGELETHAGHIDSIAESVEKAHQAADTVRLGTDVYGKLCQFVPAMFDGIERDSADVLGQAAEALHDSAMRLREAARRYTSADEQTSGAFRELGC